MSQTMTREWKLEHFGAGPWLDEPDREEFEHAGLPCLITRNPFAGYLCGYVAVLPGHSLHGVRYGAARRFVDAHGGVTYSEPCSGHVCHVPRPGEPDNVWWFGFDCGHCFDLKPIMTKHAVFGDEEYRDIEYVRAQVRSLAEQLASLPNDDEPAV